MRAVTTSSIARPRATTTRATRTNAIERRGATHRPRARERVVANGLFGLGLPEIVVIGGVAAVLFGPSKLPELGKSLGKTVKSFQEAAKEFKDELKEEMKDDGAKAIEEKKDE